MVTVKVLKRRDAASVVVAIVLGFIFWALLSSLSHDLANVLTGRDEVVEFADIVRTVLAFGLELVLIEVGLRLAIFLRGAYLGAR